MQQPTQNQQVTATLSEMKDSLTTQLNQSLLRASDLSLQLESLNAAKKEEDTKVKMIRDTLQGISLSEQAVPEQDNSKQEIPKKVKK